MKKYCLVLVCLLLTLAACTRVDKVLPKNEGAWQLNQTRIQVYMDAELQSDTTIYDGSALVPPVYTFQKGGSGTLVGQGFDLTFEWSYDNNANDLSLVFNNSTSYTYSVLESSSSDQVWFHNQVDRSGGINTTTETTLRLAKLE